MIERRPFTPEDYRIGHEGSKGTSDYPTKGTAPRDVLKIDSMGRRKRNIVTRGSVSHSESLSPTLNPEESLIEAEEALQSGEQARARDIENDGEEDVVEINLDHDSKDSEENYDSTAKHRLQMRVDSERMKIGLGSDSQKNIKHNLLRKTQKTKESHGTHKPKGKKPRHY